MNFSLLCSNILQETPFITAVAFCYIPMKNQLRISPRKLSIFMAAGISVFLFLSSYVRVRYEVSANTPLFLCMLFFFFIYNKTLKTDIYKKLFLFFTSGNIVSFPGAITCLVDAWFNPNVDNSANASWYIAITSFLCACLLFLIFYIPMKKQMRWLIDETENRKLWKFLWVMPFIFMALNVILVPYDYRTLYVGRIFQLYLLIEVSLFGLLVLLYYYLYQSLKNADEKEKLNKKNYLLAMQASQYTSLRCHMEETRHLRHDFRQQLFVILGLVEKKNYDSLKQYLTEYCESTLPKWTSYCANPAADALIGYYDNKASSEDVLTKWHVELPQRLSLPETDFCIMLGNLLENAIDACQLLESKERFLQVIVHMPNASMLSIIVENSYQGTIRKQEDAFLSIKHAGTGIGLVSVQEMVKKHGGELEISYEHGLFSVHILIQTGSSPEGTVG